MEKHSLKATKRKVTGRKVKSLRKDGILPANIYGKKIKSLAVQVAEKEFETLFLKAGETGLVELSVDDEKRPVLIHNVQYHPVTGKLYHVDLLQVDLKEKVVAKVPVILIGESPAVKDKVGVILNILSEIEVEALPGDLPDRIGVDITHLSAINDSIKVSQIKVSDKVKILSDSSLEIVKVAPLVSKEAEKMAAEEAAAKAAVSATSETAQAVPPADASAAETPKETAAPSSKQE